MIYLTGDIHGDPQRLTRENLLFKYGIYPEKKDIFIIVGDFGIPWLGFDNAWDKKMLDLIASFPFTVAFIDGNHENFPLLAQYPVVENWHGGRVQQLRPNLFHLLRGEVYKLEGHTFFTMGGAMSTDKWIRREGVTWWPEEVPSLEEWKHAEETLDRLHWKVDYVVTHTPPSFWKVQGGAADPHSYDPCPVSENLDQWEMKLQYKKWFFGHMHRDRYDYRKKDVWLYQDIVDYKVTSDFDTLKMLRLKESSWTYPVVYYFAKNPPDILFPDIPDCSGPVGKEQAGQEMLLAKSRLKWVLRKKIAAGEKLPAPTPEERLKQKYPGGYVTQITLGWEDLRTKEEQK